MDRSKGDTPCWGADPELGKGEDHLESDYHSPVWPRGAPGVAGARHVGLLSTPQPLVQPMGGTGDAGGSFAAQGSSVAGEPSRSEAPVSPGSPFTGTAPWPGTSPALPVPRQLVKELQEKHRTGHFWHQSWTGRAESEEQPPAMLPRNNLGSPKPCSTPAIPLPTPGHPGIYQGLLTPFHLLIWTGTASVILQKVQTLGWAQHVGTGVVSGRCLGRGQ